MKNIFYRIMTSVVLAIIAYVLATLSYNEYMNKHCKNIYRRFQINSDSGFTPVRKYIKVK